MREHPGMLDATALSMSIRALLFDLDGTLIRTNDAHVDAWLDAFARFDHQVSRDRVKVEIGKGGDLLVPSILGKGVEAEEGEALRGAHARLFKERIERDGASFFEGVDELLSDIKARGLRTALATSSSPENLEVLERQLGRSFASMFDVVTSKDDAEVSKPAPDILEVACEKLGEEAPACLMIGDSLHDASAARKAGIAFVGVTTGFIDEARLIEAGACFVARDLAHLRASLGEVLDAASRGHRAAQGSTRATRSVG
jgi:HAD superfamily hydrolase (TIGR01549 family)